MGDRLVGVGRQQRRWAEGWVAIRTDAPGPQREADEFVGMQDSLHAVEPGIGEADVAALLIHARQIHVVPAQAHPAIRWPLILPEAHEQDHILAALDLLGYPPELWLVDLGDDVALAQTLVADIVLDTLIQIHDIGAVSGRRLVGEEVERQLFDKLPLSGGHGAGHRPAGWRPGRGRIIHV